MGSLLRFLPKLAKAIGRGAKGISRVAKGGAGTKAANFLKRGATKVRSVLSGRVPKFIASSAMWVGAGYGFDKLTEVTLASVFGDNVDQEGLNKALCGVRADLLESQPTTVGQVYYICENNRLWDYLEKGEVWSEDWEDGHFPPYNDERRFTPAPDFDDFGPYGYDYYGPRGSQASARSARSPLTYYASMVDVLLSEFRTAFNNCVHLDCSTALAREQSTTSIKKLIVRAARLTAFLQLAMDECCVLSSEDAGELYRVLTIITTKAALVERQILDPQTSAVALTYISKARGVRESVDSKFLELLSSQTQLDGLISDHFPLVR